MVSEHRRLEFDTRPGVAVNRLKPRLRVRRTLFPVLLIATRLTAAARTWKVLQSEGEISPSLYLRTAKLDGIVKQQKVLWEELKTNLKLTFRKTPKLDQKSYRFFAREVFQPTTSIDFVNPEGPSTICTEPSTEIRFLAKLLIAEPAYRSNSPINPVAVDSRALATLSGEAAPTEHFLSAQNTTANAPRQTTETGSRFLQKGKPPFRLAEWSPSPPSSSQPPPSSTSPAPI